MSHYHAIVWIDHREARVFHFSPTEVDHLVLHPHDPTRHIHHKANSIGSGHAADDQDFLHSVTEAIADAGSVLITGPANAKAELMKHMHRHDPRLIKIIAGVETVDHPTDGALVDYARHYFKAADRMQPGKPYRQGDGGRGDEIEPCDACDGGRAVRGRLRARKARGQREAQTAVAGRRHGGL